jgi:nitrogen fixation/metabolism regulation signal transduction histidine kinase
MRLKVPIFNAVNFAVVFGVITHLINQIAEKTATEITPLFVSNIYLNTTIWLIIGFIIGLVIELTLTRHKDTKHMPEKVSTKLIVIPSVLLFVLIVISVVFLAGLSPFELEGHSTADTEEDTINTTTETNTTDAGEDTTQEESNYDGMCEEKTGSERVFNEAADAYVHENTWEEVDYGCNIKRDCTDQLTRDGESFDSDDIRCII